MQSASDKPQYLWMIPLIIFMIMAVTITGAFLVPFVDILNIALLYLLPVMVSAVYWGRGASVFASFLGILAFDYFIVPPVFGFKPDETKYFFTFAVYLIVAMVISTMATTLRDELEKTRKSEQITSALYAISRQMVAMTDLQQIWGNFVKTIAEIIDGKVILMLFDKEHSRLIEIAASPDGTTLAGKNERDIAERTFAKGENIEDKDGDISQSSILFLPIKAENRTMALLTVTPKTNDKSISTAQHQMLDAFTNLAALALLRLELAKEAEKAKLLSESEKLHTALLNSVSHEIRTPLASITGAATSLLEGGVISPESRDILLCTIKEEAQRMNRFTSNLLDMTRLESGMLKPNLDWCDLQDIIGVAIREIKDVLQNHNLKINIPAGLPLVKTDFALIEHVVINLLENAVKYSPPEGEISLSVQQQDKELLFSIINTGPVIPIQDRKYIFDKFYRLHTARNREGIGLGLSICKGIIEAHEGKIWIDSSEQNKNLFIFSLPILDQPSQFFEDIQGEENAV
jgi:two-component system sensor histidine kinase KdpD